MQGEKIRDLEMCLEEHRMKLNATEELLQQVSWVYVTMHSKTISRMFGILSIPM